jgi:hypothetical protein
MAPMATETGTATASDTCTSAAAARPPISAATITGSAHAS